MTPGVYVALHRWLDTEFGPGQLFKVGHSADLGARLLDSAYATCFPAGWLFVAAFETLSKRDAFHLEQWALRACRHRRVDGRELVRASVVEITDIITRAAHDLKISVVRRDAPSYPGAPARPNGRSAGDAGPALPVWDDCEVFTLPPWPGALVDSVAVGCATTNDACSLVGDSSDIDDDADDVTVAAVDDAVADVAVAAVAAVDVAADAVDDAAAVDDAVDALPLCTSGVLRIGAAAEPVVLRDYQENIVNGVLALLPGAPAGHIRVRMACGTGKSIVIAAILRRVALGALGASGDDSLRQLVVVPSVYLLSQLSKTIEEWGVPCARLGGGFKFDSDASVVVCVNNSLHLLAECEFQHVFVDEAHHLDYNKDGLVFYETLNLIKASGARVLLSATLMRGFDGDALPGGDDDGGASSCDGTEYDGASASLDDDDEDEGDDEASSSCGADEASLACRDFAFNYSIEDGLNDDHLCDYNIVIPLFVTAAGRMDRMPGLIKMVVEHPEMTRVLAYCNSIKSAEKFCELAVAAGVNSRCFFGDSPVALRDECIEALKDEIRMIVTVNTITEGADIPWADTAILVEPRRSKISIVQVLGRILRQYGGVHCDGVYEKKIAYMVLPASDEESTLAYFLRVIALEDSRFRKLSAAGSASSAAAPAGSDTSAAAPAGSAASAAALGGCAIVLVVDADGSPADFDAVVESVRFFSRYGEPLLGGDFNAQLALILAFVTEHGRLPTQRDSYRDARIGAWANTQRMRRGTLSPERIATLEAVPGWVWAERTGAPVTPWPDWLVLLLAFVTEYGRLPRQSESYYGVKIGSWIANQRTRRGTLSPERVAALEAVPGWVWGERTAAPVTPWPDWLALLLAFVMEHDRLPRKVESYRGAKIGTWVNTQRQNRVKLAPERVAALEAVPGWVWGERTAAPVTPWPDWLALLVAFVTEHGRLPRESESYCGAKIGNWISTQRGNKGKLPPERVAALEAVPGWVWAERTAAPVTPWPDWLALLSAFVTEHGRLPRDKESYRDAKIGTWVSTQRTRRGTLSSPERVAALEAVPGWVWEVADTWPDQLALLVAFVTEHGRLPRQSESYRGVKIGSWISNQRTRRGTLSSPERVAALEAVPGWVWEVADTWPDQLALLVAFVTEHGRLPTRSESYRDAKIGAWIGKQRSTKSKMAPERVAALEAVPGWAWEAADTWPDQLALLVAFMTEHGRLPRAVETYRGVKIGSWIHTQRQTRSKMAPERVAALEAVPGWVWAERPGPTGCKVNPVSYK